MIWTGFHFAIFNSKYSRGYNRQTHWGKTPAVPVNWHLHQLLPGFLSKALLGYIEPCIAVIMAQFLEEKEGGVWQGTEPTSLIASVCWQKMVGPT